MNQTATPNTRKLLRMAQTAMEKHRGEEALQLLNRVVSLNPYHAEALKLIGFIFHSVGQYAPACQYYQRAIAADPSSIDAYLKLSAAYAEQNMHNEALQVAKQAALTLPENPDAHTELVRILMRFNHAHLVPDYAKPLLERFPHHVELHHYYCLALRVNNRHEEADAAYQAFIARNKMPAHYRIAHETFLPRMVQSAEEIDAVRKRFESSCETLLRDRPPLNSQLLPQTLFQLAFHNRDNKHLNQLYQRMIRACAPEVNYTAAHCRNPQPLAAGSRIRVGFATAFFYHHSVGSCYRNTMLNLAKSPAFEVFFFNLSGIHDEKIQSILDAGVTSITMPKNLKAAQQVIAEKKLDILIYPEIGMDAMTYYLAMARLAPHQACMHGHPDTTGIDTMDYFISSRLYEQLGAQANYTEQLLCLDGVDTILTPPQAPTAWPSREALGLPADKKLYVCPLTIQKFHPDFDAVLAGILDRDPESILVLFNDFQQQAASDLLKARVLQKCAAERVLFLGWQPLETLFAIMKTADALLDTIYFGAGSTSQFAFSFGVPIVTMPSQYMRGRVVETYYRVMEIENPPLATSPEHYIEFAYKLAHDGEYKATLSTQISNRYHRLSSLPASGLELEHLLKSIVSNQLTEFQLHKEPSPESA